MKYQVLTWFFFTYYFDMLCLKCTNYLLCICFSNVVIKDMTILAPLNAPNTDGIDPGMVHVFYSSFFPCNVHGIKIY